MVASNQHSNHSPNSLKNSEKESGLAIASVGVRKEEEEEEEDGKVATLLGTREKRLLSLSLVATMESDILFSKGLSCASAKSWGERREEEGKGGTDGKKRDPTRAR